MRTLVRTLLLVLASLAMAAPAAAETYSWVDEDGITHLSDDPVAAPPSAQAGVVQVKEVQMPLRQSVSL